ncbi:hypothetical protein FXO38_25832 [Capsicum annuum]|nr:hypothetical protein FXO37_35531 [Capsicum annuum]KAF3632985.1 hypothetical protein FXO38_25832 [Capsicum annuum]
MTCKPHKYDSAGTSASSELTHEQLKEMFNLNSDTSSEEEMEMQKRNNDKKLRDDESFLERMHKKIETAFNDSDSEDDEPSQDPGFGVHINIEGLTDELCKLLSKDAKELKEEDNLTYSKLTVTRAAKKRNGDAIEIAATTTVKQRRP